MNLEETYVSFNATKLDIPNLFNRFVKDKVEREDQFHWITQECIRICVQKNPTNKAPHRTVLQKPPPVPKVKKQLSESKKRDV